MKLEINSNINSARALSEYHKNKTAENKLVQTFTEEQSKKENDCIKREEESLAITKKTMEFNFISMIVSVVAVIISIVALIFAI